MQSRLLGQESDGGELIAENRRKPPFAAHDVLLFCNAGTHAACAEWKQSDKFNAAKFKAQVVCNAAAANQRISDERQGMDPPLCGQGKNHVEFGLFALWLAPKRFEPCASTHGFEDKTAGKKQVWPIAEEAKGVFKEPLSDLRGTLTIRWI